LHSVFTNGQVILRIGLGIGLESRGRFWGSMQEVFKISFLYIPFLLWRMHSFSLCPWFSHEAFYTVMSFKEISEDTGDLCFSLLLFVAILTVLGSPSLSLIFLDI
jgi:hypothetical protein